MKLSKRKYHETQLDQGNQNSDKSSSSETHLNVNKVQAQNQQQFLQSMNNLQISSQNGATQQPKQAQGYNQTKDQPSKFEFKAPPKPQNSDRYLVDEEMYGQNLTGKYGQGFHFTKNQQSDSKAAKKNADFSRLFQKQEGQRNSAANVQNQNQQQQNQHDQSTMLFPGQNSSFMEQSTRFGLSASNNKQRQSNPFDQSFMNETLNLNQSHHIGEFNPSNSNHNLDTSHMMNSFALDQSGIHLDNTVMMSENFPSNRQSNQSTLSLQQDMKLHYDDRQNEQRKYQLYEEIKSKFFEELRDPNNPINQFDSDLNGQAQDYHNDIRRSQIHSQPHNLKATEEDLELLNSYNKKRLFRFKQNFDNQESEQQSSNQEFMNMSFDYDEIQEKIDDDDMPTHLASDKIYYDTYQNPYYNYNNDDSHKQNLQIQFRDYQQNNQLNQSYQSVDDQDIDATFDDQPVIYNHNKNQLYYNNQENGDRCDFDWNTIKINEIAEQLKQQTMIETNNDILSEMMKVEVNACDTEYEAIIDNNAQDEALYDYLNKDIELCDAYFE
eukprot:403346869